MSYIAAWPLILHILVVVACAIRILLRDDLTPDGRMAWLMVLVIFPLFGLFLYFMFGEVYVKQNTIRYHQRVAQELRQLYQEKTGDGIIGHIDSIQHNIRPKYRAPFYYLHQNEALNPVGGNTAQLMEDGDQARATMLKDISQAKKEINILYYIWLVDDTGTAMAEAIIAAAHRGVTCRVMVDALGSRRLIRSHYWQEMKAAGVHCEICLPFTKLLKTLVWSRLDLRNHRKILVIDGDISYIGSQNCADEDFAIKAKYAPWIDIMLRVTGPVAAQNRLLFAVNWALYTRETLKPLGFTYTDKGFYAQIMSSGPTSRKRSVPQFLVTLMSTAKKELIISTPYFIPDMTVLEALCTLAYRGINVKLILPKKNDSWIVAAASHSHYRRLLSSGVQIYEHKGGLLHAKTLTIDGDISFIGSTNIDLRSFDLNYENNVLVQDKRLCADITRRQYEYISQSEEIHLSDVRQWPYSRRLWNNILATVGPVL